MCYVKFKQTNQIGSPLKISQSTLNGEYMIKITKTCTFVFVKERNSLVVRCREKLVNRKIKSENGENIVFKALISVNIEANQLCQRTKKLFTAVLLSNGLHENVMICYLKLIRCTVC